MPPPVKPPALRPGDAIRILSLASPVEECLLTRGCAELERLGYAVRIDREATLARQGYFAGPASLRCAALKSALASTTSRAIFCSRGGYGSNYLLEGFGTPPVSPRIFLGFSDITSLQIFLWQKFRWVTFYGPMVASTFASGAGAPNGYDFPSLSHALSETQSGWDVDLLGECLIAGSAEGVLLGGCLTLIAATLGTPWELDTRGAVLLLEDRGMKPYQVDRALMHLKQAGKLQSVAAIVLGDFPECDAAAGVEPVKSVAERILGPLNVPVACGAAVGHTARPMLTLPLGVRARLTSEPGIGGTRVQILEPACVA